MGKKVIYYMDGRIDSPIRLDMDDIELAEIFLNESSETTELGKKKEVVKIFREQGGKKIGEAAAIVSCAFQRMENPNFSLQPA